MTTVLEERTAIEPKAEKGPYKTRRKPCLICGQPSVGVTSYYYFEDGTNGIGVPFCQPHLNDRENYATPVFENQNALNRFKNEHPILFNRYVAGKKILFMQQPKTNTASVA
jgi:hypothetical protein